ncbi:hypothetical protein CT0861_08557, partial [Colletotrichum tofieldiae]
MGKSMVPNELWRRSALAFAVAAFLTFIVNLTFVLWATFKRRDTLRDGIGTISEQSCESTKRYNTGLHIVINIISTVLLAGSNYCMQCLIAPTRSEITKAHASRKWLDVGIPSLRNLWSAQWNKKILWFLLAASSFPLHLLYNSVVFTSISSNNYYVFVFNVENLHQENTISFPSDVDKKGYEIIYTAFKNKSLEPLSVADCFQEYGTPFQSSRGNLLLAVSRGNNSDPWSLGTFFYANLQASAFGHLAQPSNWICSSFPEKECDGNPAGIQKAPGDWAFDVQECYGQKTTEHCKLLFSGTLGWIVTSLNLLKGILMLIVAFGGGEKPMLTVGDAVASFLEHSDPPTKAMCLKSKQSFLRNDWLQEPRQFDPVPRRKLAGTSVSRWIVCLF